MSDGDAILPASLDTVSFTYENLPSLGIDQLCEANHSALKSLFATAPEHLRSKHSPVPRSVYKLLAIVLAWREDLVLEKDPSHNVTDDPGEMDKMFALSVDDLDKMARDNLAELIKLVDACLRLDPGLTPRSYNPEDRSSVCGLVLKWQIAATRAALERRDLNTNSNAVVPPTEVNDDPPPSLKRANPLSGLMPEFVKRPKFHHVGGVPTGEGEEDTADFGVRLGGPTPVRPSQLKSYPGRSTVLLNVQQLMGPSILHSLCQEGFNVELVIRNVRWSRQSDGRPFSSEVEALTLARCLHFHLCNYGTMEEAIATAPWTEIALRRLWALLEVENLTSGPSPLTRDEALQQVLPALEVYPDAGIRVPAMSSIVNRHISAASRARNAVRSLNKRPRGPSLRQRSNKTSGGKATTQDHQS